MEQALAGALTERFGRRSSGATPSPAGPGPTGRPTRNALDVHVLRFRRRVAPIGLELRAPSTPTATCSRPDRPRAERLIGSTSARDADPGAGRRRHRRHVHRPRRRGRGRRGQGLVEQRARPRAPSARRSPPSPRRRRSSPTAPTVATNALLEQAAAHVALPAPTVVPRTCSIHTPSPPRCTTCTSTGRRRWWTVATVSRSAGASTARAGSSRRSTPRRSPSSPPMSSSASVCLLHADLSARHERAVGATLRARGVDVTCSHEVSRSSASTSARSPRSRTRCSGPSVATTSRSSRRRRRGARPHLGRGLIPADDAAASAAFLLSGPAGGVRGPPRPSRRRAAPRRGVARHGRHEHRRLPHPGRRPPAPPSRAGRRLPDPAPGARRAHDRRRRRPIAVLDAGGARPSGPAAPAPSPVRRATGARVSSRPSPTRTSRPGRIDPARDLPGPRPPRHGCGRAPRRSPRRRRPAGVVAVVDTAMEEAVRAVTVARGSTDPGWPSSCSVAPGRSTAVAWPTCSASDRHRPAAAAGRCRRRAPGVPAAAARPELADARRQHGLDDALREFGRGGRRAVGPGATRRHGARLPLRRPEPRARPSRPSTSPMSTADGTAMPPRRAIEVVACAPARAGHRPHAECCPTSSAAPRPPAACRRRARLHGLGARGLGGPAGPARCLGAATRRGAS